MPTPAELWSQVTGTDVLVWAAMDKRDTTKRIALYKNRAGISGKLTAKQLYTLGESIESLPVIKSASEVAMALRAGYPPQFRWDYFDLILSSFEQARSQVLESALDDLREELRSELFSKTASVFHFKGNVEGLADLPSDNNEVGDVYQIVSGEESGAEYCWIVSDDNGHWEYLGKKEDLSSYATKDELSSYAGKEDFDSYVTSNDQALSSIEDAQSQLSGRIAVLEESPSYQLDTEFIKSANEITRSVNKRYLAKATLTGSLPTGATTGDEVIIVVLEGAEDSVVSPGEGDTINGSNEPISLRSVTNVTTFVYDADSNDWANDVFFNIKV